MIVLKEFEFDAAHYLPEYNGKCERLHGHTYKLVVKVQGTPDHEGMVIDFIRLKNIVKENVLVHLDHACINDILPQPSAEYISVWVWNKLKDLLHGDNYDLYEVEVWETKTSGLHGDNYDLYEVEVWETKTSGCIYRGDL